jgi:hypothetical protein
MLVVIGVLFSACGGASGPGVASVGSTTTTSPSTYQQTTYAKSLKYAECMRAHGNSNFPDPNADGFFDLYHIPFSVSANDVCQHQLGPQPTTSSASQQKTLAEALKFSICMRAHGLPNFPDPKPLPGGGIVWEPVPPSYGPSSPIIQRAQKACGFITSPKGTTGATFTP